MVVLSLKIQSTCICFYFVGNLVEVWSKFSGVFEFMEVISVRVELEFSFINVQIFELMFVVKKVCSC